MPLPLGAFPAAKIQLFFDTTKKIFSRAVFPHAAEKDESCILLRQPLHEVSHGKHIDIGEWRPTQSIEMRIFGHYDVSAGGKSAIDELVVVRVGCNHAQAEMRVYVANIALVEDEQDDILRNLGCGLHLDNLLILFKDFVGHAQGESLGKEGIPYRTVGAPPG